MSEQWNGLERAGICTLNPCPVCAPATERAVIRAELDELADRDPLFEPTLGAINAWLERAESELDREEEAREERSALSPLRISRGSRRRDAGRGGVTDLEPISAECSAGYADLAHLDCPRLIDVFDAASPECACWCHDDEAAVEVPA